MESMMSPADVAAVTRGSYGYNDGAGWGGNGAWVLIILFALIFGWGGNGFGSRGGAGEPVTESGLCNSMNFNNLENAVGRLNDNQAAIARQNDNGLSQLGYQSLQIANQTQRDLCSGFTSTNAAINQSRFEAQKCCCETQEIITAQTQKILDAICGNRMADMQNQINQLQLQAALCGIPRTTPYGYGIVPQFAQLGCACGCNGNI